MTSETFVVLLNVEGFELKSQLTELSVNKIINSLMYLAVLF